MKARDILRPLVVTLALPMMSGVAVCGDVLYDTSQRALILDPVEAVRFTVDSGSVEVNALDRTAISLFYYFTGSEDDIDEVGYELASPDLLAFITCNGADAFCTANFSAEVPLGTVIEATTREGSVKLIGVDADVKAVVAGGGFDGIALASPTLDIAVEEGDVTIAMRAAPTTVTIGVGVGNVDLTLPPGSYRCELQASGTTTNEGVTCDPMATAVVKIDASAGDIHLRGTP